MNFINFDEDKCDECFKCLRVCETKAISFTKKSRHIIDDLCIKCGICQMHCHQEALTINLDIKTVQQAIKQGKKVIASIAPSFAGAFIMESPYQMSTAIKKLGFYAVEETARGAEMISREYEKEISQSTKSNIITSCCPSSNYLIEHYFKDAVDAVITTVSPMLAHGYDIKARHGEDTFVVFIGPCLAKKAEALEITGSIDAVITFKELEKWLIEEKVEIADLNLSNFDTPTSERGRAYPLGGSLWKEDLKTRINTNYEYIHIDGIEACKLFLESVESKEISGYCAELNICSGSCINGPNMPEQAPKLFKRMQLVKDFVHATAPFTKKEKEEPSYTPINKEKLHRSFSSKPVKLTTVSEDQIEEILLKMDKYTKQDQLNCNACGYSTCYEKAIAVAQGYSDISMCLDTLRKKTEGLQNIIFEASPNAICILNEDLDIQHANLSFNKVFNKERHRLVDWPITCVIDDPNFEQIISVEDKCISKKIYIASVDKTFYFNLVRVEEADTLVGVFTDITQSEKNREELERVKVETVTTCQDVIEHQMRVAQEIASLLGETTAETKVGLNKLKKLVLSEGE
ncbi:[Fe-Fe] hydrogenase large subunit C-terminal domain-containing protein [Serpentinicella sp. ANB-PHB4]|uniref:[Fe-Fe] hydrogenase large subunit C-terminal domain-containing protein n=1 Tax=Serpentinicella sp. ANB-PHB4 TaxID=3074076 RepID=UPI002856D5AD|nr:[Fe-Fe] hydrogenase large subunit C-terminal domain-containing protein [Serpentinicella sp. ANB-PHB4]MDR5659983.1 [Fe-Fe] hydrogenase large subunit C-terminal domain-containing protein [Serpentinicella sp. ANB-PHB4]